MRLGWLLLMLGSSPALAADPSPCDGVKPGDRGLRLLVEHVFKSNESAVWLQRKSNLPETPVRGTAAMVDVVKWCQCTWRKKVEKFGPDLAASMCSLDPKVMRQYTTWVANLPPMKVSEHDLLLRGIDATCVNESQP